MAEEVARPMLFVVNPASANRTTGRAWPGLAARLREAGLEHEARLTAAPGDASAITRQALREGFRTIVSVGGDGTVNEVVNGFFDGEKFLGQGARLGVISRGTGRDLIRTLGLPKDEGEAIARLKAGKTRRVDVGRARFLGHDGKAAMRHFINIGEVGLGGDTVARVNRTSKALGGKVSFLWGTVATLAGYRNKNLEVVIDGGQPITGRMCLVAVANGQYFGGGMRIAPDAAMDDGIFDVVIIADITKPDLLVNIPKVYKGTHTTHPKISFYHGREIAIRSSEGATVDLDGEQPGRADATFSILPGLVDVIV